LNPNNIIPTIKYGGEGINFFGFFSDIGVGILEKIEETLTG